MNVIKDREVLFILFFFKHTIFNAGISIAALYYEENIGSILANYFIIFWLCLIHYKMNFLPHVELFAQKLPRSIYGHKADYYTLCHLDFYSC